MSLEELSDDEFGGYEEELFANDGPEEQEIQHPTLAADGAGEPVMEELKVKKENGTLVALLSDKGLPLLVKSMEGMKPKGPGHEASDLRSLLLCYEQWSHKLFPSLHFKNFLERVQRIGGNQKLRGKMKGIAQDYDEKNNPHWRGEESASDSDHSEPNKENNDNLSGDDEEDEEMRANFFDDEQEDFNSVLMSNTNTTNINNINNNHNSNNSDNNNKNNKDSTTKTTSSPLPLSMSTSSTSSAINKPITTTISKSAPKVLSAEDKERMHANRLKALAKRKEAQERARLAALN